MIIARRTAIVGGTIAARTVARQLIALGRLGVRYPPPPPNRDELAEATDEYMDYCLTSHFFSIKFLLFKSNNADVGFIS